MDNRSISRQVAREAFQYIEKRGEEGVTPQELYDRWLFASKQSAANWLSRWLRKGYLRYEKGISTTVGPGGERVRGHGSRPVGRYLLSKGKWWGEMFYRERDY